MASVATMSTPPSPILDAWRSWLIAAGRPETTVHLRVYQVARFCGSHPEPFTATTQDLADWLAAQNWSAATRASWRAALTAFYRWAVTTGRTDGNPALELPVVRVPRRVARPTPEQAITAALEAAEPRVALMVQLAWRCGLRRGEIAQAHGSDLIADEYGYCLVVHGKGGKERIVPMPADLAEQLRAECRQNAGYAFPGAIAGHLSARRVGELVAEALPGDWTCHTLRHRFGTSSYAASGGNLLAVQQLLGHAKPETTQLYVQLPGDALRQAVTWAA